MKKIVLLLAFIYTTLSGYAQWSTDPGFNNPVCTQGAAQVQPQIISDGAGGGIICWTDSRPYSSQGSSFIYAQRIHNGVNLWTPNGIVVSGAFTATYPKMISDGNGGAIISWIDVSQSSSENDNANIYIQRIDSLGNKLWADQGAFVSLHSNNIDDNISMIPDGYGGAFVVWNQKGSGANSSTIQAQHITSSGVGLWGNSGTSKQVSSLVYSYDAYQPKIASDHNGGVIICWYDNRYNGADRVYAQRLDSLGNKLWNADDVAVCNTANSDVEDPDLITTPDGNALITWADTRIGSSSYSWNIYTQKLSIGGSLLWSETGVPITHNQYNGKFIRPFIVKDNDNGAYISFYDNQVSAGELLMQHIDSVGNTTWADSLIVSSNIEYPGSSLFQEGQNLNFLTVDSMGNAVTTWEEDGQIDPGIHSQVIDVDGNLLVDGTQTIVCSAPDGPRNPKLTFDSDGNEIVTWEDWRNGNPDIYASRFMAPSSPTGLRDVPESENNDLFSVYPNPGSDNVTISKNSSDEAVLKVVDINGKNLGEFPMYKNTNQLDMSNLPEGLYLLKMNTKTESTTKKWLKIR